MGFKDETKGFKLPLTQSGEVLFVDFLRNIGWDIYVGGRFTSGDSFVTLRPSSGNTPPIPPDVGLHTNLRALGFEILRDSRPNRFYPVKGSWIDLTGDFFAESLGSKYSYQSYKITFNKYFSLTDKQVVAYNLFLCGTGGAPPFYGNCIYGTNSELRGYTAGRISTCLRSRRNTDWCCRGDSGWWRFPGWVEWLPERRSFEPTNFCPLAGRGSDMC